MVVAPSSALAAEECTPGYPDQVTTTTRLTLDNTMGRYGSDNSATVRTSSTAGTPTGKVVVSVSGTSYTLSLSGGSASHALPDDLSAQETHTVTARYQGKGCYKASSDSAFYTVYRVGTDIRGLDARNIRSGGRPSVEGRVVTDTGVTPGGSVRVRLFHSGDLMRSDTVSLHGGRFDATFGRVTARGSWTARVAVLANNNHGEASDSTTFRVR